MCNDPALQDICKEAKKKKALVYSINGNLDAISGLLETIRSECLMKSIRLIRKSMLKPFLIRTPCVYSLCSRLCVATSCCSVPDLDLPWCAFLHGLNHAPVRHLSGPLRGYLQPYPTQPLQLAHQSHAENRCCLDHLYRSELTLTSVWVMEWHLWWYIRKEKKHNYCKEKSSLTLTSENFDAISDSKNNPEASQLVKSVCFF